MRKSFEVLLLLGLFTSLFTFTACSSTPSTTIDDDRDRTETDRILPDGGMASPIPPVRDDTEPAITEEPSEDTDFFPCDVDGGCPDIWGDAGPACGDGRIDPGELCDDGNSAPGDGCTGSCRIEPNWRCPEPGEPCVSTIVCGNGRVEGAEVCDDGNTDDGDGCSGNCESKDPNYDCSVEGELCVSLSECGDGIVGGMEFCDDFGEPGGCNDTCDAIEDGWLCLRPGVACILEPRCGDGLLQRGEQCDDANDEAGDGCSPECLIEDGFYCPSANMSCIEEICGDGVRSPSEQCDDGNTAMGDGCSETCEVEAGYVCPLPGALCFPRCGDGVVTGTEDCDDGNTMDGDGCGGGCLREAGYACPAEGGACTQTVCGDGIRAGDEGCDDGNHIAGDGCGPTCQIEPTFNAQGVANLACGDGLITGDEQCDDGNVSNNDGCSSTCEIEPGWRCGELLEAPENVQIAVTYRDFMPSGTTGGHPHFQLNRTNYNAAVTGIAGALCTSAAACGTLDSDRKPVKAAGDFDTIPGATELEQATSFAQWYRNDPLNETIPGSLNLIRQPDASYVFDRSDTNTSDTDGFFPLNDVGFGNSCPQWPAMATPTCCTGGNEPCDDRNYHFTTELGYFFQYRGGEELVFRGDDDVWVFINGRLAVDIGGIHTFLHGRVVLGDSDSSCAAGGQNAPAACATYTDAEQAQATDARFGITKGGVYEIKLFHAERRTSLSNFRLTLKGFLAPRSSCSPICGDGVVQRGEVCDDGDDNVTFAEAEYGKCVECRSREFCGDAVIQADHELCDNGLNISTYDDGASDACAPGCVPPPYCGDGMVQPGPEWCDLGAENNTGGYDGCTSTCDLGPYCGDGHIDEEGGEVCDNGLQNGGYGRECTFECQPGPYCGDGIRNGPEQCDLGAEENTGAYGGCRADCTLAPRCGDGQRQASQGEQCDDGVNDGGYGECAPGCVWGPRCGDGHVQKDNGEVCDDGVNDGGYGECAPGCVLGPRCGDRVVQQEAGEQCDDGPRGSTRCTPTCKTIVRDPSR